MKLFKKLRKGFTLIELVVVIAVIAVLAAVSVVSYIAITNNAKKSNDQQLIDQVNLSLKSHEITKKPATMHEALTDVEEDGFIPANFKITPEFKGYTFAYNLKDNQFVILNEQKAVVYPKDARKDAAHYELWLFADTEADVEGEFKDYSHYTRAFKWESGSDKVLTAEAGLDLGSIKNIGKVKYATNAAQDVVIRTVGDQTELELNAPNANANFYGFARKLDVTAIKNASLHIYGTVYQMEVESGHVAVENTGIVFEVTEVAASGASISNAGYIAENTSGATIDGKAAGGDYEINSLDRLEGFRDAVNAGNNFHGLTVKLTQDIALTDGWTPIGEGHRDVGSGTIPATGTTTFFAGEFNGNNKTISNLNNKGFAPNEARLATEGTQKQYAYGLFALVGHEAYIHDLKMRSVDIDASRYSGALADSVGAVVGYSHGSLRLENIEVSGSIKAEDSAGGIIGRTYATKYSGAQYVIIKNCSNSANISVATNKSCKAAGILGFANSLPATVQIQNNSNTGTISGGAAYSGTAASTFVAGGVGTYVLRASIAVVGNTFTDAMHSGNTNGGVAVSLVASASSTKLLGAL